MKQKFNFKRLIHEYSMQYELVQKGQGSYIDGEYVLAEESVLEKQGAILPLSMQKIYQSGGSYTQEDRQLYSNDAIDLTCKSYVRKDGKLFEIQEDKEYKEMANVYIYILKWVKNFDRTKTN